MAIAEGLKRFLPETVSAGIAGVLTLVLVPGIMAKAFVSSSLTILKYQPSK